MPQHIGIVGCSAEGAALCYKTICAEGAQHLGPHAHPEISMHTPSLAEYVACLDRGDLQGVGELMLASARKLAASGADFLICPDNTIHQALPLIEARSPLPWLHIAEVVAGGAGESRVRRRGQARRDFGDAALRHGHRHAGAAVGQVGVGDQEVEHRIGLPVIPGLDRDLIRGNYFVPKIRSPASPRPGRI